MADTNQHINLALMRLSKRAESADPVKLVETFVDTGTLKVLLASHDHQIIYGRRGTGKTHALIFLSETRRKQGDLSLYVDMRTIGSTGGIYNDPALPIPERATRLLKDTLTSIHDGLLNYALDEGSALDLGHVGAQLDAFIDAATEVVVTGPVSAEHSTGSATRAESGAGVKLGTAGALPSASVDLRASNAQNETATTKVSATGAVRHRVQFGAVGRTLSKIAESIRPKRIWILLDEWSVVPLELQPYLADLLRRCVFPTKGVTVKIGAIDQRTQFQLPGERGDYVGIEVGADASADLNLDDFMVFDNDADRSVLFFRTLLYQHYKAIEPETSGSAAAVMSEDAFIQAAFTQRNVFEELVRAAEGVPRDAINVIGICAQKAAEGQITMGHIREAAKSWYQRDKAAAVAANDEADRLLHWITDEVIAHRRARAFLLLSGRRHRLIDSLFDSRVLHLLKRNVSAPEQPGIRYDVYKIDYGCYVDLLTTAKAPQGLLPLGKPEEGTGQFVEVPPDDYRAIRRAILDLEVFERGHARHGEVR